MTLLPLLWMLVGGGASAPSTKLRLVGEHFVISRPSGGELRVPLDAPPREIPDKKEFRSDQTFVLWDRRGLTIRVGGHTMSTRLSAVPTSPRLRDRSAIVRTVHAIKGEGLSREAAALSGSCRFGKTVYLVLRWITQDGRPWLEALVSVDLGAAEPAAKALAVLPGISFSSGGISENLVSGPDAVRMLIHDGPSWGVWTYKPSTGEGAFHKLGDGIKYAAPLSLELAAFVEKTDHGTFTAGTVDLESGTRTDTLEAPSLWRPIDSRTPPIAQAARDSDASELANLVTGAVLDLPEGASVRRTAAGVLVWVGGHHPTRAWLYDPVGWKPVSWWKAT